MNHHHHLLRRRSTVKVHKITQHNTEYGTIQINLHNNTYTCDHEIQEWNTIDKYTYMLSTICKHYREVCNAALDNGNLWCWALPGRFLIAVAIILSQRCCLCCTNRRSSFDKHTNTHTLVVLQHYITTLWVKKGRHHNSISSTNIDQF